MEMWVNRGSPQGWGHWQLQTGKIPLGLNLLGAHINPTIEPIDLKAGLLQAKKLPGGACNPIYQHIIGLKLYLDSILKSRHITLLMKVHPVKAMVFPVVIYGCESWTIKKVEHRRIDAFELWF